MAERPLMLKDAPATKRQEILDRIYVQNGPCCAGCDWWHHVNSLIGECHKSAPVSAEERYSIVQMDWHTWRFRDADAGHILTNREHHCGDFKDEFDWTTLPPRYLRRIGKETP
jgi:hypothetical protein